MMQIIKPIVLPDLLIQVQKSNDNVNAKVVFKPAEWVKSDFWNKGSQAEEKPLSDDLRRITGIYDFWD